MRLRELVLRLSPGSSPSILPGHLPDPDEGPARRPAGNVLDTSAEFAVLVPLIEEGGVESVLLTKRPDTLDRYAGQVSFPGGARDPADRSLAETALREAHEEVGIPPDRVEIIREIDWHETALRHRVKPFIGRVRGPCELVPDPREVERILFLPVARITPDLFRVRGAWRDSRGRELTTWTFDLGGFEVWGLTARILRAAFTDSV